MLGRDLELGAGPGGWDGAWEQPRGPVETRTLSPAPRNSGQGLELRAEPGARGGVRSSGRGLELGRGLASGWGLKR